ncbi:proton channel OTOP1 [Marmota marmota marmota]|uniref:proton channel OTOP1 n=1 Tax=Marmota marmota marmota TaxID=9994 RepID=UPI0007625742|nr:proton channel OTOP1 [Marmota marmota marmota]
MPAGPGTPASPGAPASASDPDSSGPPDCPPSPLLTRGSPESPAPRQAAVRASVPQKLAETLSSQYGLNVFVAGLLFLLAWAVHAAGVGKRDLLCFLTALMLLQLLWMLWYVGRSYAQRRLIRPKDAHAGARWLRGSISLFAIITVILGCFKVGYFIGFSECLSAMEGVFPVTHAVHTLLQVYFLWGHAKDIIQSFKTLERFGVIHSVVTNLLLWANSVLNESKHQLNEHKERLLTLGFGNITLGGVAEPKEGFVTQGWSPGLSAAAFAPGVFRAAGERTGGTGGGRSCSCPCSKRSAEGRATALPAGVRGLLGGRPPGLDADLLVGTASGSWLISWGSILAMLCATTRPRYTWFNLPYSALVIAEKYIQNLFIIESVHREPQPLRENIRTLRVVAVCSGGTSSLASSGPRRGAAARAVNGSLQPGCGKEEEERGRPPREPRVLQGSTRRSVLRNVAVFLFLCNISLWVPPAFGCRPEYDNGLEEVVFGFEPWIIVVNLAMPFSIFYRMHAAASLFEVYCKI